jgi:adenylate cyclase
VKAFAFWLCSLVLTNGAFAQEKHGQVRIDSLLSVLSKAKSDTDKVKLQVGLAYEYIATNPRVGLNYGLQAVDLSEDVGWKYGIAQSNRIVAQDYMALTDYPNALKHSLKAYEVYAELNNKWGLMNTINQTGVIYRRADKTDKAVECFKEALRMAESIKDSNMIFMLLANLAGTFDEQRRYDLCLEYEQRALGIAERLKNEYGIANLKGNIGVTYAWLKNYALGIKNMYECLEYDREHDDKKGVAMLSTDIARQYITVVTDSTIAELPDTLRNRTLLLSRARHLLDTALAISTSLKDLEQMLETKKELSRLYSAQGNYKAAFDAQASAAALKDSIYSEENTSKIEALTRQRQEDLKQKEIDLQKVQLAKARQERWFYSLGLVSLMLIVALVTLVLFNTRKAKRLSDHLLHNILPVHTANELKQHGHAKAKRYDNVTVLFTDFKEFAKLAEKLSPEETVSLIHHYFTAFDRIVKQHGLEKIKTIGDAYMAAAGVPVEDPNHALHAVKAALAIRDFVKKEMVTRVANNQPFFYIRIGVHSGPVVAGIVGESKFAYDIWGDTVNLAARMESSGEPGKVNVSGATYSLIKDRFACRQRGAVEVKHGGLVEMYFLESEATKPVAV